MVFNPETGRNERPTAYADCAVKQESSSGCAGLSTVITLPKKTSLLLQASMKVWLVWNSLAGRLSAPSLRQPTL
jgi:hypothetical protein